MDQVKILESDVYKPWLWFRYVDDVFFIWTYGQENFRLFLENLQMCYHSIKFTHETNEADIALLDLKVKL